MTFDRTFGRKLEGNKGTGFQMPEVRAFQAEGTAKVLTWGIFLRNTREPSESGRARKAMR